MRNNTIAKRNAYRLDKIEEYKITADKIFKLANIANNQLIINNIRLFDREALLFTFS